VEDELAQPIVFSFPLRMDEVSVTLRALEGYVASWHQHYKDDAGQSHSPEDWEQVRVSAGQLIWRLEEAMVLPGQAVGHSPYAVEPPPDEAGGTGVREPRRPRPSSPSAHNATAAQPAPDPA